MKLPTPCEVELLDKIAVCFEPFLLIVLPAQVAGIGWQAEAISQEDPKRGSTLIGNSVEWSKASTGLTANKFAKPLTCAASTPWVGCQRSFQYQVCNATVSTFVSPLEYDIQEQVPGFVLSCAPNKPQVIAEEFWQLIYLQNQVFCTIPTNLFFKRFETGTQDSQDKLFFYERYIFFLGLKAHTRIVLFFVRHTKYYPPLRMPSAETVRKAKGGFFVFLTGDPNKTEEAIKKVAVDKALETKVD